MVSEVIQMNAKVPFLASNTWAYRKAIENENVAIDITIDDPAHHWPVNKSVKYKLKVDDGCGLVFKDEAGQHVHLGHAGPARAIQNAGAYLHCSDEVNEIINTYIVERAEKAAEEQKIKDLDLDEMFNLFTQKKEFEEGDKVTFLPFYFDDEDEEYSRPRGFFSMFQQDDDDDEEGDDKYTKHYYRQPSFYAYYIREIEYDHPHFKSTTHAEIMFKNHDGKIVVESVDRRYLQKWKSFDE